MADQQPLDQLFRVLPDVPELARLREAMLGSSVPDPEKMWASASHYTTFDKRVLPDSAVAEAVASARAAAVARVEQIFDAAHAVLNAAYGGGVIAAIERLLEMGEAAESTGDAGQARAWYSAAASLAAPTTDRRTLALALRRLARANLSLGDLGAAESYYRASEDHANAAGDAAARAVALTGLGNALSLQGRFTDAGVCYEQALELTAENEARLRAQLQVNLAMVAREAGEFEQARRWLDSARTAWPQLMPVDRSGWHNFAGLLALSLGSLEAAHEEFVSALATATGRFERAMVLDNLTEVAIQRAHLTEAEVLARRAEQHALAAGSPRALAEVYIRLGRIFRLQRDPNGVTFFEKALELCRRHEYRRLEATACLEYATFRSGLGDVDEARAYERRAHELLAGTAAPAGS